MGVHVGEDLHACGVTTVGELLEHVDIAGNGVAWLLVWEVAVVLVREVGRIASVSGVDGDGVVMKVL